MSSFILGSSKTPHSVKSAFKSAHFDFLLGRFQRLGLPDETAQLGDLFPQIVRIEGDNDIFQLGNELLLLFFGQLVEILREPLGNLLLPVLLRVLQNVLTLGLHPLQTAPHRVDARCEAPLEHRHREPHGTTPRAIVAGSRDGLVFDIARQLVIEVRTRQR